MGIPRAGLDDGSTPALLRAAADDPDGFRLLFRHAAREPEFRDVVDSLRSISAEVASRRLAELIPAGSWLAWAAGMAPTVTLEAVIAWLDAGQPDPCQAADRIGQVVHGAIRAAQVGS